MEIIKVVSPVLTMILVGMVCRKTKFLSQQGVDDLKKLVTKVILPVAVFHALATADYSGKTLVIVGVMLAAILLTFLVGFGVKRALGEPYRKYVPYMVSVYEGGMMAYPLFANLCGAENLSVIAVLDIAGLIFGFSIYMGMLQQTEDGSPFDLRFLITDALKNPTFIASLLGIVFGVTGVVKALLAGPFGPCYERVENILTVPLTSMILLVVGYSMKPEWKQLIPCLKTIGLRAAVQAVFLAGVLLVIRRLYPDDTLLQIAFVMYMSAPATFSMQSFLKTEEAGSYAATTNSLYCIVSILVYTAMAFMVR